MVSASLTNTPPPLGRLYSAVNWITIAYFALLIPLLFGASIAAKDAAFMRDNPGKFVLELIIVIVIPTSITSIFIWTRRSPTAPTLAFIIFTTLVFCILHVLLQAAGYYTDWFAAEGQR